MDAEFLSRGVDVARELIAQGSPRTFAAAMAGNAMLESGARTIAPSKDGSDGLWQWRDAANVQRLSMLKNYAAHHGLDWRDMPVQCAFALYECANNFPDLWALRNTDRSVATLTMDFCDQFERPAAEGRVPDIRIKYAEAVYNALANEIPAPPVASPEIPAPPVASPVVPAQKEQMNMPAILLADILPILAPVLGKVLASLVKELEASNPGLGAALKTICDDLAQSL